MTGAPDPHPTYARLPEPVDFGELITSADTDPVPDPEAGRDANRDFMLRNAG